MSHKLQSWGRLFSFRFTRIIAKLAVRYLQLPLNLFHQLGKLAPLTLALSPKRVERDVGKLAALVSQGKICVFQQSPVSTAIIQPFLVVRHHQVENMGELTDEINVTVAHH